MNNNIVEKQEVFAQKAYDNILTKCQALLSQFPITKEISHTLSVESQELLSTPIASELAEFDAERLLNNNARISFGIITSKIKAKLIIHNIVLTQTKHVCSNIGINTNCINTERLKATLMLYIAYNASIQMKSNQSKLFYS